MCCFWWFINKYRNVSAFSGGDAHERNTSNPAAESLSNMEQWEDFVQGRYREGKSESEFRQYDAKANPGVAEFYRLNHR